MKKLIVFTAPSGAGKTTIVRHLLQKYDQLAFSISATTRPKRKGEEDGKDYYFISKEEFKRRIEEDAFVEWEEVYADVFYGTLKDEIDRIWGTGKHVIFDIDVQGAINLKHNYPESCEVVFVKPPSLEVLIQRLKGRKTESEESLKKRIEKLRDELDYADRFDHFVLNDQLPKALHQAEKLIEQILESSNF